MEKFLENENIKNFFCDGIEDAFLGIEEFSSLNIQTTRNTVKVEGRFKNEKRFTLFYHLSYHTGSMPYFLTLTEIDF